MESILSSKLGAKADVIVIQELRASTDKPRWLLKLARSSGYGVVCSHPTDKKSTRGQREGGTAILWKRTLGRTTTFKGTDDRLVGIRLKNCTIVNGYGPGSDRARDNEGRQSLEWFKHALQWAPPCTPIHPGAFPCRCLGLCVLPW
jgi:exonuclease III